MVSKLLRKLASRPSHVAEQYQVLFRRSRVLHVPNEDSTPDRPGLRPITIADTLRKLTALALSRRVRDRARDLFLPVQLPNWASKFRSLVIRSYTAFTLSASPDTALLSLDLHNAFNRVDHKTMAQQVGRYFPELLRTI